MNTDAEYVYLAVDKTNVADGEALCKGLRTHLESQVNRRFRNRIRSLHWHLSELGDFLLIHLAPGKRDLLSFRGTPFFAEFIDHALRYLAPYAKSPRLLFYNDEIGQEVAMRNPETWTLEKLQTMRHIPAGVAVAISAITSLPASPA